MFQFPYCSTQITCFWLLVFLVCSVEQTLKSHDSCASQCNHYAHFCCSFIDAPILLPMPNIITLSWKDMLLLSFSLLGRAHMRQISIWVGCMVIPWLALSSHNNMVLRSWLFSVEFTCSSCSCKGFLQVLEFPCTFTLIATCSLWEKECEWFSVSMCLLYNWLVSHLTSFSCQLG